MFLRAGAPGEGARAIERLRKHGPLACAICGASDARGNGVVGPGPDAPGDVRGVCAFPVCDDCWTDGPGGKSHLTDDARQRLGRIMIDERWWDEPIPNTQPARGGVGRA
jgi:hypothetical protein